MTGEWLGGPECDGWPEGDCPAVHPLGYLCTLMRHSPDAYHEAWGVEGDKPYVWWLADRADSCTTGPRTEP